MVTDPLSLISGRITGNNLKLKLRRKGLMRRLSATTRTKQRSLKGAQGMRIQSGSSKYQGKAGKRQFEIDMANAKKGSTAANVINATGGSLAKLGGTVGGVAAGGRILDSGTNALVMGGVNQQDNPAQSEGANTGSNTPLTTDEDKNTNKNRENFR